MEAEERGRERSIKLFGHRLASLRRGRGSALLTFASFWRLRKQFLNCIPKTIAERFPIVNDYDLMDTQLPHPHPRGPCPCCPFPSSFCQGIMTIDQRRPLTA